MKNKNKNVYSNSNDNNNISIGITSTIGIEIENENENIHSEGNFNNNITTSENICYKCNKTDKLQPLLEEGGRFVFCMRCKVNLILYDVLTEDEYSKIVLEKMNYKFNDKIKKDSFNKFVNNMNAYI